MHRVVVHVPDGERVGRALKNTRNLLDDFAGDVEVVLIFNGSAVDAVVPANAHADFIWELMTRGVRVAACARALRNHRLNPGDLMEGVESVPGGVTEVVRLQGEGYAYLRP